MEHGGRLVFASWIDPFASSWLQVLESNVLGTMLGQYGPVLVLRRTVMFVTAYLILATTSLLANVARRRDSAIQDEIDDNYSAMAFDNWFAQASKQTFVAEDNRCQSRFYLPAIREIQQIQRHALQTTRASHPIPSNATTVATSRPPPIDEDEDDDDDDTAAYEQEMKESAAGHRTFVAPEIYREAIDDSSPQKAT